MEGTVVLVKKIWKVKNVNNGNPSITLACFSPDQEENFPGFNRRIDIYIV
jgi:hypothetical protein